MADENTWKQILMHTLVYQKKQQEWTGWQKERPPKFHILKAFEFADLNFKDIAAFTWKSWKVFPFSWPKSKICPSSLYKYLGLIFLSLFLSVYSGIL